MGTGSLLYKASVYAIDHGMKLKIAILGTRGIPNHYGGFEHISEYVSAGLVQRGHSVTVYNSHNHPYTQNSWNGVQIRHCYDPEYLIGTAGQFVYDLNCILDARKQNFDVIMLMGYTSSSVWGRLYPEKSTIITNMDGLEWKRSKYSKTVQTFLRHAEKLAVKHSQFYISDSMVIKSYLQDKYNIDSKYIPYGADVYSEIEREQFNRSEIAKEDYFLLMARMEPENNIETILEGFNNSNSHKSFKVLGDTGNRFGKYITHKFKNDHRIQFKGSIFDASKVRSLQNNSYLYFHGHSVGGTNPSLLEAMASEALIAAHNNPFNKSVLHSDAFYFSDSNEVRAIVETVQRKENEKAMVTNNLHKIKYQFNWENIIDQYEGFMMECYYNNNYERVIPCQG
jgi:glycosyltransferase involved in cell wall biosynthesis